MAGNEFGLTEANALNVSANDHSLSVEELFGQLQALIQEMENDVNAQGGNALAAFRTAKAEFVTAYNALADKYGVSAMTQGSTSTEGFTTDDANEAGFAAVPGAMPAIKPINIGVA
ncbi:hypothetical protein GCM10009830_09320 [Glycomyces endophyticus]|uniref:WXG100 family type VII secretion target n=1 Tax=Glycomyces endophyticus TaxID=480996 RepID=A0ABN2G5V9_9ACTN